MVNPVSHCDPSWYVHTVAIYSCPVCRLQTCDNI